MPCSICAHPKVHAIAAAVARGDSYRTIEGAYGVSKSSVSRHTRQCLTAVSVTPQAVPTAPAHLVNADGHHLATQLAGAAMRCYETGGLRHVVRQLAELLAQVVRDAEPGTETTASQADEAARQWNRL